MNFDTFVTFLYFTSLNSSKCFSPHLIFKSSFLRKPESFALPYNALIGIGLFLI